MRPTVILTILLLALAGCADPYLYPAGGSKDCRVDPLEDLGAGFRVTVPKEVVPGDERTTTKGWCVTVREVNGSGDAFQASRPVDGDGLAVLPVGPAGAYNIHLSVPEPDDRYCSYSLEAYDVEHPGSVFVDVELTYDGVSACT